MIVDYKAAIRYLRHNRGAFPGDTERIITNGTSAGGTLSTLAGATGNHPDYAPYLAEIGAAEEGQMEWIKYSDLSVVKTVDDFDDLLKVMNTPELTEFQYLVSRDEWTVSIR